MTDGIAADAVRTWARLAVQTLAQAAPALDRANVFPVPDGDTGTNLLLTLREGARAVDRVPPDADADAVAAGFAHGCVLGARGNSGVIVAEWLRAAAVAWPDGPAQALAAAARACRAAVAGPVDGTALTTADAAARAALAAVARTEGRASAADVLGAACAGATDAVLRSPVELGAPGRGRLDAGAQGLRLVVGALAAACGAADPAFLRPLADPHVSVADGRLGGAPDVRGAHGEEVPGMTIEEDRNAFASTDDLELMFTLEVPEAESSTDGPAADAPVEVPDVADAVRDALGSTGTSVAVVGADGTWRGHVHTLDPGSALDAAVAVARRAGGRLRDVQVRDLGHQLAGGLGVVAVTSARGLVLELARAGAVVLAHGPRRTPPGPVALRRAIEETRADVVVLVAPPGTPPPAGPDAAGPGVAADDPVVVRVETPTDAHTVAALTALATLAVPAGGPDDAEGPSADARRLRQAERARDAVAGVRAAVLPTSWSSAVGVVEALLAAVPRPGAVVVVHGALADPALLDRLREHVAARDPGAEVLSIASGREDGVVHVGVEPSPTDGEGAA